MYYRNYKMKTEMYNLFYECIHGRIGFEKDKYVCIKRNE